MELYIAGGCSEHGRNCFYVKGSHTCILVDCGIMEGSEKPSPILSSEQIKTVNILFLTHSHLDHSGSLLWLYENGFNGVVLLTYQTYEQLSIKPEKYRFIDKLTSPMIPCKFDENISFLWGRSGHCAGSVWYCIEINSEKILFSGDYIEDTLVYSYDKIADISADIAVLDCAYSTDETTAPDNRIKLLNAVKDALYKGRKVFMPVPKYGRGLEMLALFQKELPNTKVYADDILRNQLQNSNWMTDWIKDSSISMLENSSIPALVPNSEITAPCLIMIADPQLKNEVNQNLCRKIIKQNGLIVFTGNCDSGSFSEQILNQNSADFMRYNVHQNLRDVITLNKTNDFKKVLLSHSKYDFSSVKIPEKFLCLKAGESLYENDPA